MPTSMSGAQYRKSRVARGLPAFTPNEKRSPSSRKFKQWGEEIAAIKVATGCVDCGYNAHPAALDHDHLPGTVKVALVSQMWKRGYGWASIVAEMAKCEVVCANCHRVRTATRQVEAPPP